MLCKKLIQGSVIAAALLVSHAVSAQDVALPRTMVWTSYDLGSGGYVEASAMADAIDKAYGTTVRLTPSGTAIGRLLPLVRGRATFGFMGNEILFASNGTYEFAAKEWGPQDLRVLMGRTAAVGLVAGGDTDIETPADLKGASVGFVEASPSTTMNTEAALAFAGLTPADVNVVTFPGYGAMLTAFIAGDVDVVPVVTTSAALREAEGGRGFRWLDMPASDTAGWARVTEQASLFSPIEITEGAGISAEDPAALLGYRYPQLTTLASTDDDEVYNLLKALDETFASYESASTVMPLWKLEEAGKTPAGAPFHPGAIKYLTERGIWTDTDSAWNEKRLAEVEASKKMWADALASPDAKNVSDADWPAFWETYLAKAVE